MTAAPGVVRPTIRCLREDLGHAKLQPASLPLDRLDPAGAAQGPGGLPDRSAGTLVLRLLPAADDQDRIRLEQAVAAVDELRTVVGELVITSARSGAEQSDEAGGCAIAVLVRRTEYDEVYIGVRIVGPVQETVTAVILAAVPAVADPAGWFLDAMPGRSAAQGELVWSNLLDQTKLNDLLQEDSSER